jgi:hypothetical protein
LPQKTPLRKRFSENALENAPENENIPENIPQKTPLPKTSLRKHPAKMIKPPILPDLAFEIDKEY